jgi:hypothetical protein
MAKRTNPLVAALKEGRSYQLELPKDGDLASMRERLKHGQVLTISPLKEPGEVQVGDIVFLKWRGGNYILHIVKEIQGGRFLIMNSMGKINGWANGEDLLGRVTRIIEPNP